LIWSASWSGPAAFVICGNTDLAVTDGDFTAAFPWFTEGAPDS